MRRLGKPIFVFAALALLAGLICFWLAHRAPDWYQPQARSENLVAGVAMNKYLLVPNMAAAAYARERQIGHSSAPPDIDPVAPVTVSFSADEINAQVQQWSAVYPIPGAHDAPQVQLSDDEIIVAAQPSDSGVVMSVYLRPRLDAQGMLHVDITGVRAGALPLPQALLEDRRRALASALQERLDVWRKNARVRDNGAANSAAAGAAAARIMLDILAGRPTPVVVFAANPGQPFIPIRLTALRLQAGVLTLTFEPLDAAQRRELRQRVLIP